MGSAYARLRGSNDERTGLPTYCLLTAPHKDGQYARELQRVAAGSRAGALGSAAEPFNPGGSGPALTNMQLHLPAERLEDRRLLRRKLDDLRRGLDLGEGLDPFEEQAVSVLLGGAARAFDLSLESRKVVERYDTSMFPCGKKVLEPSILGKQMLLARRLIEAGAGFVTVQSAGWDMHADVNNPGIKDGMEMLGRPLDRALSAFLEDVEQRGLLDRVLLVVTGDFGRTPKINKNGGRDHWPNLCTLALFGGGLNVGQVIGSAGRNNDVPASEPVTPGNLLSTLMHALFDVGVVRVTRGLPANLVRVIESTKPIEPLFS
jgi:uncharacterized protein (DUF1501 family)